MKEPRSVAPFAELRALEPVWLSQDLELVDEPENIALAASCAERGMTVAPVKRRPPRIGGGLSDSFPRRVLFEMTSICNTRCKMCPQTNLKRKLMHMDKDKYKSVLDELDTHGVEGLWLYHFGESLTHPHFRELVEHVGTKRDLGHVWLSTNGILLDPSMQDFLLSSAVSYLNFSLQGISAETYREIAPTSPAERILASLAQLVERKKDCRLQRPYFRLQIIEQEVTRQEIDPFLADYYDKCDLISVNMLEHTDLAFNARGKNFRKRHKRVKCRRISRSDCFINSDGSVTICDNAYNHELDIGNVWESSIREIWSGPERQRLLGMNEDGSLWNVPLCSDCTDYDL